MVDPTIDDFKSKPSLSVVLTGDFSSLTQTTVTLSGTIKSVGNSNIINRGICYSTNNNPSISGIMEPSSSFQSTYSVTISNLSASTKYYYCAYAENSSGVSYGSVKSFTTIDYINLQVTTNAPTSITQTSATLNGYVNKLASSSVVECGFCWDIKENPTVNLISVVKLSSRIGNYSAPISGLTPMTKYYVKAFAKDEKGVYYYGDQVTFTTMQIDKQRLALEALFNSTNGNNWVKKTNWCSNEDISTWYGVTVYNGNVTKIQLRTNNLIGAIPSQIKDLTQLKVFDIGNDFSSYQTNYNIISGGIDLSSNTSLSELILEYNRVSSLEIGDNINLTRLICYSNNIQSLDLHNNTSLAEISCSSNPITYLNVQGLNKLTSLNCLQCILTSLNVSSLSALSYLDCSFNKLTSLDVSSNLNLSNLFLTYNKIKTIDLNKNTKLMVLSSEGNLMKSLNIRNNIKLENVYLGNQQDDKGSLITMKLYLTEKQYSEKWVPIWSNVGANLNIITDYQSSISGNEDYGHNDYLW